MLSLSQTPIPKGKQAMDVRSIAIFAPSFGKDGDDVSNRVLAGWVAAFYKERPGINVYAQEDVATYLPEYAITLAANASEHEEGYIDTVAVVRAFLNAIEEDKEIRLILLVAQPWLHRPWCVRLLKKALGEFTKRTGREIDILCPDIGSIPFDPNSTQWYTRGRLRTLCYGLISMASVRLLRKTRTWR